MKPMDAITQIATNAVLVVEELADIRHRTDVIKKIAENVVSAIFTEENEWIIGQVRYQRLSTDDTETLLERIDELKDEKGELKDEAGVLRNALKELSN